MVAEAENSGEDLLGVIAFGLLAHVGEVAERDFERNGDGVEAVERDGLLAALHLADELDGIRDETRYSSGRAIRTAVSMLRLRYWRSIGLTT